ncbi:thiolase family protein [Mycolicibacterium vaccae]|uniref:Acetyl-CoA acetyltransferase n=1 Tax=Mycolicibacterium vaccae ATCC 25954 TaxID=1194972 RepID=K0VMM3_MYCVA|nr:thiolase family protein [Mycolicibacterium vaccae]EJZ12364.1 acetyl-CoA acetyltransferase [Mycolicibacterium vaccae ATCC 25954]MCV7062542.1 thiolase family protein [Mycolicibacterium vaccae]
MAVPRGAAPVISGAGISHVGRRTGISAADLTVQASAAAIADAGLTAADIDGVLTLGDTTAAEAAALLGIPDPGRFGEPLGPAGLLEPVAQACAAVAGGRARHMLVYRTVQMMGGTVEAGPGARKSAKEPGPFDHLLAAHAYSAANWLAMHCRRHMDVYGTTKEQLGWVAINARRNAGRNPLAVYRDPITMDDYLNSRPISSPFGLLDCDVPVDGSIAFVVSTPEHRADSPFGAVTVEATGGAAGTGGWYERPDYPNMAATDAAADMWSKTTLAPGDVDLAELYDGFSYLTLAWLEALGFCAEGEAGPFVDGGTRIAPDGALPLNTYGGQLSAGRMHGYWVLYEAVAQLRGRAGPTALPKRPEVAVVSAGGGPIAGCVLLTC